MLNKQVHSDTCIFFQIFKTCSSLSNLSQYQETAKTKTAASKIDAVPNSITDMSLMLENSFLTALPYSEQQLSTKKLGGYCSIPLEDTA